MEDEKPQEDVQSPRKMAVPGMKRKDGTYVVAVIPPEWESYFIIRILLTGQRTTSSVETSKADERSFILAETPI